MIEKEELIKGTMIIAKYMGANVNSWYPPNDHQTGIHADFPKDLPWPDGKEHHALEMMKYHSDFSWIMPVVIKINSDTKFKVGMTIYSNWAVINDSSSDEAISINSVDWPADIGEAIFTTVWESIEILENKFEASVSKPLILVN